MSKLDACPAITNRRAFHNYQIEKRYEAGIVLIGCEVKSVRRGQVNLQESFARFDNEELWLYNCHISPFKEGNRYNADPTRARKLLLHKKELKRISTLLNQQPLALVPLKMYLSGRNFKIELGLGKGKKQYDKRAAIKKAHVQKSLQRRVKHG